MDISSVIEAKGIGRGVSASAVDRANDQAKVEGAAAVQLINAAGEAGSKSSDPKGEAGNYLDVFA